MLGSPVQLRPCPPTEVHAAPGHRTPGAGPARAAHPGRLKTPGRCALRARGRSIAVRSTAASRTSPAGPSPPPPVPGTPVPAAATRGLAPLALRLVEPERDLHACLGSGQDLAGTPRIGASQRRCPHIRTRSADLPRPWAGHHGQRHRAQRVWPGAFPPWQTHSLRQERPAPVACILGAAPPDGSHQREAAATTAPMRTVLTADARWILYALRAGIAAAAGFGPCDPTATPTNVCAVLPR